jgi:5-methylcytosine-specific restriction endonuclease McrA
LPRGRLRRRSVKKARKDRQLAKASKVVADRGDGMCEAQIGSQCRVAGSLAHHVLPRSRGGGHEVDNLVWLCWPCHSYIHDHPGWSVREGWTA